MLKVEVKMNKIIIIIFILAISLILFNKIQTSKTENNHTEQNDTSSKKNDGLIQETQKTTFESNSYSLMKTIENAYLIEALTTSPSPKTYYIENGNFTEKSPTLKYNSPLPDTGIIQINETGDIRLALYKIKWCASKEYSDNIITIIEIPINSCNLAD